MIGPGNYDAECTELRERLNADGAILVIVQGERGNGFSCQIPGYLISEMPTILRNVADAMEAECMRISAGVIHGIHP